MADLKFVSQAVTKEEALENLSHFKEKWGKTDPSCVKSWEDSWEILSTFYAYPAEIWKIIYTTNIMEDLNRQFRQITKNKPSFRHSRFARTPCSFEEKETIGTKSHPLIFVANQKIT